MKKNIVLQCVSVGLEESAQPSSSVMSFEIFNNHVSFVAGTQKYQFERDMMAALFAAMGFQTTTNVTVNLESLVPAVNISGDTDLLRKKVADIMLGVLEEAAATERTERFLSAGVSQIAKEREEQVLKHGRTVESDREFNNEFQLGWAASILNKPHISSLEKTTPPKNWNKQQWLKMCNKPYEQRLIIAGALSAAEYDCLSDRINP